MKKTASYLAAAFVGAALLAPVASAEAHDRGERHEWRHDNGWHHGHHKHHHHHHRHQSNVHYGSSTVIYQQPYYVAPPPPVVYRPAYYGYGPEPAVTIGVSIPPLVIPLR